MAGFDDWEEKKKVNCDAPLGLYKKCQTAPPGHPLHTVEGFVQCTTLGVVEVRMPAEEGGSKQIVAAQRPHPDPETRAHEMPQYRPIGGYGRAKRMVEALIAQASLEHGQGGKRLVPASIVRPGLIMGVSDVPGAVAPVGWSNKGNLNYPMSYYYFSGQPNKETPPKLGFLPERSHLNRGVGACDPVDICSNHHIAALTCLLAHPERQTFIGEKILTVNSCHDKKIKRFSMWEYLNSFPHFAERNYEFAGFRTMSLLQNHAKLLGGDEGKDLAKEIQRLRRVYLYFPVKPGDHTKRKSRSAPRPRTLHRTEIDNHLWLEQQLHPSDRNVFPVTFTDRMNFNEVVRASHDYTWAHVLGGERAQQNVVKRNAKAQAKL